MPPQIEVGPALLLTFALLIGPAIPAGALGAPLDRDCVLRLADTADGSMTLAEIRQACRSEAETAADAELVPVPEGSSGERAGTQRKAWQPDWSSGV